MGGIVLGTGWSWAYQLHLLQALKRKPDLFLCERLDVKTVFQCGKWGQVDRWAWGLLGKILRPHLICLCLSYSCAGPQVP